LGAEYGTREVVDEPRGDFVEAKLSGGFVGAKLSEGFVKVVSNSAISGT